MCESLPAFLVCVWKCPNLLPLYAGVYLANQLDGKIFDQPGLMPTKQSYSDFVQTKVRQFAFLMVAPSRSTSCQLRDCSLLRVARAQHLRGWHAVQVSFNGGAHWQDLQQPESFQYPECNACKQASTCQLHLHGPSSWHYGAGAPSTPMLYPLKTERSGASLLSATIHGLVHDISQSERVLRGLTGSASAARDAVPCSR